MIQTFLHIIFRLAKAVTPEFQYEITGKIGDRRNVLKYLLQSDIQKMLVRLPLHLDQVRHFQDLGNTRIRAALPQLGTSRISHSTYHSL